MMFVILAALLLSMVTLSVMRLVAGDITEGFGGLEAVQAFNVAEAGVHYAIGQLQTGTSGTYAGETITITSGSTTLGTATITVNCIDTGGSPNPTPCSGAYAGYRRIISTSTLPASGASGGPTRTVIAIVQGTPSGGGGGSWTTAVCALSAVVDYTNGGDISNIYGDIVSNGSANMTPSGATVNLFTDPGSPKKYTGKISAVGTATCGSGCSAPGGVLSGQPGPLCSAPTVPAPGYVPGATSPTVATGTTYTINGGTGYSFNNFNVTAGTCAGASPLTTLAIQAGAAGTTTVVQLNTLVMGSCTRLQVLGAGNVDLRIGAATGESLNVFGGSGDHLLSVHFGVGATDTYASPVQLAASQLTVWVNSNGAGSGMDCNTSTSCAAWISHVTGGATVIAPNGTVQIDDGALSQTYPFNGAVLGKQVNFSGMVFFQQDTTGLAGFSSGGTYSTFNSLRSWKDQ